MIGAIILAAGSSRRYGDDKRRARLPDGKMLIQQTIDTVLDHFESVLLVLRRDDLTCELELREIYPQSSLRIFRAPESGLGMGRRLSNSMDQVRGWRGVFVFLADMPRIRGVTIRQLKDSLETTRIVVPLYQGRYGHPVGFGSVFFDELSALEGDRGAKPVIKAHPDCVNGIVSDDPGVLLDVDHPKDLGSGND